MATFFGVWTTKCVLSTDTQIAFVLSAPRTGHNDVNQAPPRLFTVEISRVLHWAKSGFRVTIQFNSPAAQLHNSHSTTTSRNPRLGTNGTVSTVENVNKWRYSHLQERYAAKSVKELQLHPALINLKGTRTVLFTLI